MSPRPATTPVDVLAVLADLQQQLTDLTGIVQAQQRTLRHLLGGARTDAVVQPVPRRL